MAHRTRGRGFGIGILTLAASLLIVPAAFSQNWTSTNTKAISLVSANPVGALNANAPMRIAVALAVQNRAGLDELIREENDPTNSLYGSALTPEQFNATFAPSTAQVQEVTNYLSQNGFTNVAVEPNNLFVTASGTAAQVQTAFNTRLQQFVQNGKTVFVNVTDAQVPSSMDGVVVSVLGLNNIAMQTPHVAVPYLSYPNSYTPVGFQTAYDAGSVTGSQTTIAIFAEGDLTQVMTDLRMEEAANKLPQVPYTIVPVGPGSTDTSGADEWDLDTQYSTGMAQTVKHLYVYDTTSMTDADVALMFNKFATQNVARAGSASFGLCEFFAYLDGSMLADDQVFAQAAAQGQTMFASAGDTGGFCPVGTAVNGVPAGAPDVNYPASSPYVLSVGGTSLLVNQDGTYNTELAWAAGGGGFSLLESGGYWQSGVVPPETGTIGKGTPDLAMDADPNSGAVVYVSGAPEVVGGTSLASPLALGSWARIQSAHKNKLGFAPPHLYAAYQSVGFHDVILGDTGPYPATPGWDLATGLGSFDIAQMSSVIK